jgi:putative membrane fusion protein
MAPDPYIEKLYREEAELNKQLEEWKVELVAPESGFISFSLDGMEDILGIKAVNYIAVKDFKNFYGKEVLQKDDGQAKAAQPFFRIVEPGKWYAACLIHDPQMTYEKGQEVDVSFLGTQINKIQGKVYRVAQEKEGSIVIIEFNDNVEQFINCRSIRVEISKKFQGFMVPADAVVSRQGERGVRIVRGDSNAFIAVNVVASDDESAIIEEKGGLKEIELHTKVLIERR